MRRRSNSKGKSGLRFAIDTHNFPNASAEVIEYRSVTYYTLETHKAYYKLKYAE